VTGLVVRGLDSLVRLSVPAAEAVWLADLLGDLVVPDPGGELAEICWISTGDDQWSLQLAGHGAMDRVETAGALAETLVAINTTVAQGVLGDIAPLHAGTFVVNGVAVAVAGTSGAGKSTTVAAAVLRGHGYLSDEVCAVEMGSWRVRPYHRPVGLRANGAAAIGVAVPEPLDRYSFVYPWRVSSAGRLAAAAPLGLIVLVERRGGPVELCEVRPADALVRLVGLSLGAAGRERVMFRRFERLAREIKVVTLRYDDVFAAVDAMAAAVS
jgi:hypothetical protein